MGELTFDLFPMNFLVSFHLLHLQLGNRSTPPGMVLYSSFFYRDPCIFQSAPLRKFGVRFCLHYSKYFVTFVTLNRYKHE